jgi:hypothetical protein
MHQANHVMMEIVISIRKQKELSMGSILACIPRRPKVHVRLMDHLAATVFQRILVTNHPGPVHRSVIDKDDLQILIRLVIKRIKTLGQVLLDIPNRDDDTDETCLIHNHTSIHISGILHRQ